jgi:hypothetical protein
VQTRRATKPGLRPKGQAMNEASSNQADGRSGIGETITTALRQPSFLRVMLLLAATVVVFVGMRLAAPILDPILLS